MISNLTTKNLSSLGPYLLVFTNRQGYQTKFDYQGFVQKTKLYFKQSLKFRENLIYASFLLKDKDST
jgi:hypothetical protein